MARVKISDKILEYLEQYPGQFVSHGEIIKGVWGPTYPVDEYSYGCLRVHIRGAKDKALEKGLEILVATGEFAKGYILIKQ